MAVVVGVAAAVVLVVLGRLAVGVLASALVGAADAELDRHAEVAVAQLATGAAPASLAGPNLRVVDTAGQPVDGGPALPLSAAQVRELEGGEALVAGGPDGLRRWLAAPAVLPDGSTRLVIVTGDVIGGTTLIARARPRSCWGRSVPRWSSAGRRGWARGRRCARSTGCARPPRRCRRGSGCRCPTARDELRALTEEINRLLARRDEAAARLERFTGDAAHELRSPVAAIRAQAEVAVAHPDPQMAEETLRAVAAEAVRLSRCWTTSSPSRGPTRAQRPPAVAVDLVAAAGAALARAGGEAPTASARVAPDRAEPVVELVAPTPAVVAATPSEVALVLDNLIDNGRRLRAVGRARGGAARGTVGAALRRGRRPGDPRGRPRARVRPVHPPAARGGRRLGPRPGPGRGVGAGPGRHRDGGRHPRRRRPPGDPLAHPAPR